MIPFFLFILALAVISASSDARNILAGGPINHVVLWCIRAGLSFVVAIAAVIMFKEPLWSIIPMLIGGAAVFASVHRILLNKWRGKHPFYIAPWGNVYDRVFYALHMRRFSVPKPWLNEAMNLYLSNEPVVVENVHRAGRLVYIAESITAVTCAAIILFA